MSSRSKGEPKRHHEHEAPTPQQQPREGLGQAHPGRRDQVKASRGEKTPPSAPSWPNHHRQNATPPARAATKAKLRVSKTMPPGRLCCSIQHHRPSQQAGSKVFTRRPLECCRGRSSTTTPPARERYPGTLLPPASTGRYWVLTRSLSITYRKLGRTPPAAAVNHALWRRTTANISTAPEPPRPPDAAPPNNPAEHHAGTGRVAPPEA